MSSFKLPLGGASPQFQTNPYCGPIGGCTQFDPHWCWKLSEVSVCSWPQTTGWVADSPEAPPVPASKVSDEHKAEQITLKAISSISHYFFYLLATTLRLATCRIMLIMLYLVTVSCQRVPLSSSPLIRNFPWESRCVDAFVIFCA